jgi:phage portal protein BeeE
VALVDRVNSGLAVLRQRDQTLTLDDWAGFFSFGGIEYPLVQTTMGSVDRELIGATAAGGITSNAAVWSLVLARMQAFSQTRFQWTQFAGSQPGDLFGTPELAVLERPWPGGTTSDLLARMEMHVSAAGNAYVVRPRPDRLGLLRPDRVTIIMGSRTDADDPAEAPDVEVVGYLHQTSRGRARTFGPAEVAHYAPYPDPHSVFLGMSWVTPVIREMQADSLATEHKARFFTNAATPNLAIKFDPSITRPQILQFKEVLEAEHRGAWNAYKTLYLGGGADPVVVGANFQQLDFAATQGKGESRLASAAGVPPSWVGFSEGLQGSALNEGNFTSARRRFADGTMYHLWTNAATSLEVIVSKPTDRAGQPVRGASLWFDVRVPFMRDDAADVAAIQVEQSKTIVALVKDGFTPESSVAAVTKNDFGLLKHSGLLSVQLQAPGGPAAVPPEQQNARNLVEMIQKVYLGVGTVITEDEARGLLNQAGASLPVPGPALSPAPAQPPPAGGSGASANGQSVGVGG